MEKDNELVVSKISKYGWPSLDYKENLYLNLYGGTGKTSFLNYVQQEAIKKSSKTTCAINSESKRSEDSEFIADITAMSKFYDSKLLIKEKPMKKKKFYHTFMVEKREVTLCILLNNEFFLPKIRIGYSVRMPQDKSIEGLSKKIALGRAEKSPIDGGFVHKMYWEDNGVLKGVAFHWERKFKDNISEYVKGVR